MNMSNFNPNIVEILQDVEHGITTHSFHDKNIAFVLLCEKSECTEYRKIFKRMLLNLLGFDAGDFLSRKEECVFKKRENSMFLEIQLDPFVAMNMQQSVKEYYANSHKIFSSLVGDTNKFKNRKAGIGGIGIIGKGVSASGKDIAIKALKKHYFIDPKNEKEQKENEIFLNNIECLKSEYHILKKIHDCIGKGRKKIKNVVKPHTFIEGEFSIGMGRTGREYALIMEYIPGENGAIYGRKLHSLQMVKSREDHETQLQYNNIEKLAVMYGMAKSIEDVHNAGVVHRDIKPGNFQIGNTYGVTVLDFGFSDDDFFHKKLEKDVYPCSPMYSSTYDLEHKKYAGVLYDMYSLGLTLYYIYTGKEIFKNIKNTKGEYDPNLIRKMHMDYAKKNKPLPFEFPKNTPTILKKLIAKMCEPRSENRKINNTEIDGAIVSKVVGKMLTNVVLAELLRNDASESIYNTYLQNNEVKKHITHWIQIHSSEIIRNQQKFFRSLEIALSITNGLCSRNIILHNLEDSENIQVYIHPDIQNEISQTLHKYKNKEDNTMYTLPLNNPITDMFIGLDVSINI